MFRSTVTVAALVCASANHFAEYTSSALTTTSDAGRSLLSKARRLNNNDDAIDISWLSGYSLKFQGCHHVKQWNSENNGGNEDDVWVITKRLARFRLCPSDSCRSMRAAGCGSGYGDYIVDLDTYADAYLEAAAREQDYKCEMHLNKYCDCEDDDQKDDGFNRDYCEYDCFYGAAMFSCIDRNPYADDEQNDNENFEAREYMECKEWDFDNGNRRNLANNGDDDGDDDEIQYYIGPYCAKQGGAVLLGIFTDDSCTNPVDDSYGRETYLATTGFNLPYSKQSIIQYDCVQCANQEYDQNDQNNGGQNNDGEGVLEQCEKLYDSAGKCENHLPEGMLKYPNYAGCNYIEGIKIIRKDGIIDTRAARPNPIMTGFIILFAATFCCLGYYVWYLRYRLGIKKNSLL